MQIAPCEGDFRWVQQWGHDDVPFTAVVMFQLDTYTKMARQVDGLVDRLMDRCIDLAYFIWLVVSNIFIFHNIWDKYQSIGMIIPYIMENKTCLNIVNIWKTNIQLLN